MMANFLSLKLRQKASLLFLIAVAIAASWPLQAEECREPSVIGKWKLTAILDFAEISSLDQREAQKLIGKVLAISPNKVTLGKRACSGSDFWAERVNPDMDLREKAHASARHLRLPSPVTVVELSCAYVYIRDRDHIVLAWEGTFFDTMRVK